MKSTTLLLTLVLVVTLVAPLTQATDNDTAPASDWSLAESSMGAGSVAVYDSGGSAVTISFPAQGSPPMPLLSDVLIGGSDPSNVFTGDFLAAGYSGIRFKIAGDGTKPAAVSLVIHQKDGPYSREWSNARVQVSDVPGEWVITLLSFNREPDWRTTFQSRLSDDALWAYDLADVQSMLLRIVPSGTEAQSYTISDFQLVGPGGISESANLTPLQAYFGVSSVDDMTSTMYSTDSDGDGMTDYNEILVGMDPHNSESVFAANMSKGIDKNTVVWQGVLGKQYAVMRSNDLQQGFEIIANAITCAATGVMQYEDANPLEDAPNFYKVVSY